MNEVFGQGTASYVDVRDEFEGAEFLAWRAFFRAWDEREEEHKTEAAAKAAMNAAAAALRG